LSLFSDLFGRSQKQRQSQGNLIQSSISMNPQLNLGVPKNVGGAATITSGATSKSAFTEICNFENSGQFVCLINSITFSLGMTGTYTTDTYTAGQQSILDTCEIYAKLTLKNGSNGPLYPIAVLNQYNTSIMYSNHNPIRLIESDKIECLVRSFPNKDNGNSYSGTVVVRAVIWMSLMPTRLWQGEKRSDYFNTLGLQ
jgi:hypothetical protein